MDPNYVGKSKAKRSQDNCEPINYNGSQAGKAFRVINKHWNNLQKANIRNKKLANFVNKFKPRLTYKSNRNLARHLVRAKLKNDSSQLTSSPNSYLDTTQGQIHIANLAGITHNQDMA